VIDEVRSIFTLFVNTFLSKKRKKKKKKKIVSKQSDESKSMFKVKIGTLYWA